MRSDCSKSFKVINVCMYDFLLLVVINCNLSFVLSHIWDIAMLLQRKVKPTLSRSPQSRGPPSNIAVKLNMLKVETVCYFSVKTAVVLSRSTRITDRQTTYDNSRTLQCNCNIWHYAHTHWGTGWLHRHRFHRTWEAWAPEYLGPGAHAVSVIGN